VKQNEKKSLSSATKEDRVVEGATCFSILSKHGIDCLRKQCPHWISNPSGHNCVMISAGNGPHTLQEIGKIYGLTRMRICQIEKGIYEKIRNSY
jgi:hypothetical protein